MTSVDRVRRPVTPGGRFLARVVDTAARVVGLRRRNDLGWPRFDGGPSNQGRPIVLVHGFGVDGSTMLQLGRRLVGRHRVVIPDLPAFGRHRTPTGFTDDGGPGIEPFLEALDDLLDRLDLDHPILVGSSMGGAIVANYAASRPQRPGGIVLIGPAGIEPPVDSEVFAAAKRDEHLLKVEDLDSFGRVYDMNFVKSPYMPRWMRRIVVAEAAPRAVEHEAILRSLESVMLATPDRYRTISCPTEIVWGECDRIIDPSGGPVWRDTVSDSTLTVVPQAGHSTMVERPEEVAVCVERLARRLDETPVDG